MTPLTFAVNNGRAGAPPAGEGNVKEILAAPAVGATFVADAGGLDRPNDVRTVRKETTTVTAFRTLR